MTDIKPGDDFLVNEEGYFYKATAVAGVDPARVSGFEVECVTCSEKLTEHVTDIYRLLLLVRRHNEKARAHEGG